MSVCVSNNYVALSSPKSPAWVKGLDLIKPIQFVPLKHAETLSFAAAWSACLRPSVFVQKVLCFVMTLRDDLRIWLLHLLHPLYRTRKGNKTARRSNKVECHHRGRPNWGFRIHISLEGSLCKMLMDAFSPVYFAQNYSTQLTQLHLEVLVALLCCLTKATWRRWTIDGMGMGSMAQEDFLRIHLFDTCFK